MFTGIIEDIGKIKSITKQNNSFMLRVQSEKISPEVKLGESIAVNGVCLTVREFDRNAFGADVSSQTLKMTNLGKLKSGDQVNLERALKVGDRLGGHFVTGHVDGVGTISSVSSKPNNYFEIDIKIEEELKQYIVSQGAVAVDGISLTVAECRKDGFRLMIVPFTSKNVTLVNKKKGDSVNIEGDMLGKYVKKYLGKKDSGITRDLLMENGFI